MSGHAPRRPVSLLLTLTLAAAACGESDLGVEPSTKGGGVLQVQALQSGLLLSRSLSVALNGGAPEPMIESLGAQGGWRTFFVPVGTHEVELSGLEPNCAVSGGTRVTVKVDRQDPVRVVFDITCSAGEILGGREAAFITPGEWENSQLWFVGEDGAPRKANLDVEDYAWAPAGDRLVVQSWGKVSVVQRTGGVVVDNLFPEGPVVAVDWSPARDAIAALEAPCRVHVAEGPGWATRREFSCGSQGPTDLTWSPRGDRLAYGVARSGPGVQVSILSTSDGTVTQLPVFQSYQDLAGVAWSPDAARLAVALTKAQELVVLVYDLASGAVSQLWSVEGGTTWAGTLQWLNDGSGLLVGPVVASRFVNGTSTLSPCEVVAVVPIAAPGTWRPLLPCGQGVLRFSVPRGAR